MHLRRMIVNFICDRVDELFPMLKVAISGNYGHLRLTPDEYNRKKADGTITDQEEGEYEEPGPFSIASYLEALLKPSFYGEEICFRIISMLFKIRISVLNGDTLIAIKVRHTNVALKADLVLVHVKGCHYIPLGMQLHLSLKSVYMYLCIVIDSHHVAFDINCVAIDLYCIVIDITYLVQCLSVPEFDEEIEGVVYKKRRVLTTLAITTEGAYSIQHEDPNIYSDDEECQFERAWPDLQLPKAPTPAPMMSEEIKATIISDMLSQHSTACKVLDLLGVDACAQHKRNSAAAVLARVSKGNRLCLSSTQALRTHIQGQPMKWPDSSAVSVITLVGMPIP